MLEVSVEEGLIFVSCSSADGESFGILKVPLLCPSFVQDDRHFIALHKAEIREMRRQPLPTGALLTVSFDSTACVFDTKLDLIVVRFSLPSRAWSCAWDEQQPHRFYVGLQDGSVHLFDLLCPLDPPFIFFAAGPEQRGPPVLKIVPLQAHVPVSIKKEEVEIKLEGHDGSVEKKPRVASLVRPAQGLLLGTLSGLFLWQDGLSVHLGALSSGPCIAVGFHQLSQTIYATFRQPPASSHVVFRIVEGQVEILQTIKSTCSHQNITCSHLYLDQTTASLRFLECNEQLQRVHIWNVAQNKVESSFSISPNPPIAAFAAQAKSNAEQNRFLVLSSEELYIFTK